jgi:phosphoglycerol transferase MdoB-like AlkP superfamily enzyme
MNYSLQPRFAAIFKNLLLIFVAYTLSRVAFYSINHNIFTAFTLTEVFYAFSVGIRFDIATVLLLSAPYVVLSLIPFQFYFSKTYQNFLLAVFFICHIPIFIFHLADIEYYKFTGSRMTKGLSALESEIKNQLDQFIVHYWHITILSIISIFLIVYLFAKTKPPITKGKPLAFIAVFLATLIGLVIGIRGGLQKKVLQPAYAFTVAKDQLAVLALNSSFTILKTSSRDQLNKVKYYPSWSEVYANIEKPKFQYSGAKNQNVIVIMLESFATEFWGVANNGEGYTPFLDSLAKKGLFFRNHFANGRKSIEAVPSIVFGLPSLMDHPLAKSKYQFNQWHGIGKQLSQHGYHTSFFHAAETGSMYFDAVTALAGLKDFYPFERYPNPKDTDGHWGIYDEPFLQYMIGQIKSFKKPFFSVAFTLTSHQPYPIPDKYKGVFKTGLTPLHESIGYVDNAVKLFFEEASKQDWFKDTLFIITGDHTQMSPSITYATTLGRYMVPLLIYHPTMQLKANTQKVVHHADILPTVIDFLDISQPKTTLFGRPVWQDDEGRALFQLNGIYHLVKKSYAIEYDINKETFVYYKFNDPNQAVASEIDEETKQTLKKELLAFIQYFNNGLIENKLYDWEM